MANEFINVYMNNPTEGTKDGTLVSDGYFTAPIRLIMEKSNFEITKLAIRTEPGYETEGEVIIRAIDEKGKLSLNWEYNDSFTAEISTTEPIKDTNKIFYLRSSSYGLETGMDNSCYIEVFYKIKQV